jgi:membrane fusion protein, multidrug efflux system
VVRNIRSLDYLFLFLKKATQLTENQSFTKMKKIKTTLFSLVFLAACGTKNDAPKTEIAPENEAIISVKTVAVEQRTMSLPIIGSGVMTSASEQRLSFKIPGIIAKMFVDEGDLVRAGQLLATLDLTEISAQVSQANRAVEKSERDLGRVEGLRRDSAATLELLQNATTARDVARENFTIANFNKKHGEIRATKSGRIIKKMMNQGEITGPGVPIFVIFSENAADWVLKMPVSDRDWARLKVGMAARIKLDAYPETDFLGKISELAPAADPMNGLYLIEIRVAPSKNRFAPGLFGQVEIVPSGGRNYQIVPIEALIEGNQKDAFVFVPRGQTVEKRAVKVAFLEKNYAVIASGLENVVEIVGIGSPFLGEKSLIRVVK